MRQRPSVSRLLQHFPRALFQIIAQQSARPINEQMPLTQPVADPPVDGVNPVFDRRIGRPTNPSESGVAQNPVIARPGRVLLSSGGIRHQCNAPAIPPLKLSRQPRRVTALQKDFLQHIHILPGNFQQIRVHPWVSIGIHPDQPLPAARRKLPPILHPVKRIWRYSR